MPTRGQQPSPCIRQCCLDGEQCLGCGRLMPEILEWAAASDARQIEISEAARQRKAQRAGVELRSFSGPGR